jgi:prophage regulatory protein
VAAVLLRLPQVLSRVGLKTTRIYQLVGDGEFPAPVRIGERSVGWVEDEVEAWIQARIAQPRVAIRTSGIASRERQRAKSGLRKAAFGNTPEAA